MLFWIWCLQSVAYVVSQEILGRSSSNRSGQNPSQLKRQTEGLFRYQQNKFGLQQRNIEEYKSRLNILTESQTQILTKFGEMDKELSLQSSELLLQKEVAENLTSLIERYTEENRRHRSEFLNYHQMTLEKINSLESSLISQFQNLSLLVTALQGTDAVRCGLRQGYIYKPEFQICYKVHPTPIRSNGETHHHCSEEGAELVKINSPDVQDFFAKLLSTRTERFGYVLIQGNDESTENKWVYDDGTPLTYFNWDRKQPNGKQMQNALGMSRTDSFQWYDLGASSGRFTYIYVCQFNVS